MGLILAIGLIAFWTVVFLLVAAAGLVVGLGVILVRAVLNADQADGPDLI